MADFTKNIKIVVDTVAGKGAGDVKSLSSGFKDLGKTVSETQGAFGKVKAAAGGAFGLIASSPAALASAGVAVGAFAAKAVGAFQDVALSAGKLSDATGLTVEQASRWNEVAGDIGITSETLTTAFSKLGKELGKNPQHFADLGVEIVRAKDGTVDMNATILSAIDLLNRTPDATKRAALGAELFGRGWTSISELIAKGSDQIKDSLDAVADSKVIDPGELDRARKFREAMDGLSDTVEGLMITFGGLITEGIGPALKDLGTLAQRVDQVASLAGGGGLVSKLIGNVPGVSLLTGFARATELGADATDQFKNAATSLLPPLKLLPGGLFDTETAAEAAARRQRELTEATEKSRAAGESSARSYDTLGTAITEAATSTTDLADAEKDAAAQTKRAAEAAKEHAAALKAEQDAAAEMVKGARSLADINLDLIKSMGDAKEAVDEASKAAGKNGEANLKALDAIIKVADGFAAQYEATVQANGGVVDATKKLDTWNQSALSQAATTKGPLRSAILDYVATLNQIPPSKLSEIKAAIDRGDLAAANALLADASKTRTATVNVALNTAAFWEDYNSIRARVRNNPIAVPIVPGGRVGFAEGGVVRPRSYGRSPYARRAAEGMVVRVGEKGEEDVWLPDGSSVVPTQRQRMWALQNNTANFTVQAKIGSAAFEREVVRAIRKFQRTNGDMVMGTRH